MKSGGELGDYISSNAPLIQIVSHEWEVVEGLIGRALRNISSSNGDVRQHLKWGEVTGMQLFEKGQIVGDLPDDLRAEFNILTDPVDVLKWYVGESTPGGRSVGYMGGYEEDEDGDIDESTIRNSVLHLEDIHMFMTDSNPNRLELISWLRQAARMHLSGNPANRTVILGTTQATYIQELDKEMPVLDIALPDQENLGKVMDACVETAVAGGMKITKMDDVSRMELIESTMGLTVMEATVAYNKAIHAHDDLTTDQIPFILNEKKQVIKRTGILEYIEPGEQEVGGLGELTRWLELRKEGFSIQAEEYGLEYPRGLLLLGFPGCGKSLTAIHTAKTWNYPLLRFDIGRAFGSLVGESERNMRQALKVAEAISPCILWIDEIEKGLSGAESSGQTDGGTSARVLGTFLTWMQEKTKPVFVLATSNNIDRMPPELTRKGRFDEIFFVDLPNHESRKDIFKIHLGSKPEVSRGPMGGYDLDKLAEASVGYTGAEIKQAVVEAMHVSFSDDRRPLTEEDVLMALNDTYPMYESMREFIEKMRIRKGKMYKPAEKGRTEPLPKRKGEPVPLTRKERRRNPFLME